MWFKSKRHLPKEENLDPIKRESSSNKPCWVYNSSYIL